MPKLIDTLIAASKPQLPTPADLGARVRDAEATVARHTSAHQLAALDAEANVPGSSDHLAEAVAMLDAARVRLANLRSALVAANEAEQATQRRQRSKLRKDNLARIALALEKRDRAAERLATHVEGAAAAWNEVISHSESAVLPLPGQPFPRAGMVTMRDLRPALERELFRVGSQPLIHNRDFPGGRAHDIGLHDNPKAIPAFAPTLKEASRVLLDLVRAQSPEEA